MIINVVVLFVTLDIGVYSNWFIAGSMLLAAILMSKAILLLSCMELLFFSVLIRPKLRRVKLDSNDGSEDGSCWRRLPFTKRKRFQKGSIQGY